MDFVDTSAWFAYFLPTDAEHQQIRNSLYSGSGAWMTTDFCVDETLTLLLHRGERKRALEAGRAFFEENIAQLHFVNVSQIHRAWIVFRQRAAAGWSFTDCTSKIVIEELGIARAIVLDSHFRQFGIVIEP